MSSWIFHETVPRTWQTNDHSHVHIIQGCLIWIRHNEQLSFPQYFNIKHWNANVIMVTTLIWISVIGSAPNPLPQQLGPMVKNQRNLNKEKKKRTLGENRSTNAVCKLEVILSNLQSVHYSNITWTSWPLKSSTTQLFNQQLIQANIKENIKAPHYTPFVREIYQSPVDFPKNGPVILEAFPCHDIIIMTTDTYIISTESNQVQLHLNQIMVEPWFMYNEMNIVWGPSGYKYHWNTNQWLRPDFTNKKN